MPGGDWTTARTPAVPVTDGQTKARWYRLGFEAPKDWAAPAGSSTWSWRRRAITRPCSATGGSWASTTANTLPLKPTSRSPSGPASATSWPFTCITLQAVLSARRRHCRPDGGQRLSRGRRTRFQQRNWIGLVGDISLSFRPEARVADVFVETSVRQKSVRADLTVAGCRQAAGPWNCAAEVLDGDKVVLKLDGRPVVPGSDKLALDAAWSDPLLWGTPPYGVPKLYTLRVRVAPGRKGSGPHVHPLRVSRSVDRRPRRVAQRQEALAGRHISWKDRRSAT